MTKDELMQLASKSGLTYLDGSTRADFNVDISEQLTEFANAILERAATDCEAVTHMSAAAHGDLRDACAKSVRSLKIKEGEWP